MPLKTVSLIEIHTSDVWTTPAITIAKNKLLKEGQGWPTVEDVTEDLAHDVPAQTGVKLEGAIAVRNLSEANFTTWKGYVAAGTPVFIRYTGADGSLAVVKSAEPRYSRARHGEFAKSAVMMLKYAATGAVETDVLAITEPA